MKWLIVILLFVSTALNANTHYLRGNITNITSSKAGLSIMLDVGVPDNCEGVSYNWLLIEQQDTAMITTLLSFYHSGKKRVTVYTNPRINNAGPCVINQIDPVE